MGRGRAASLERLVMRAVRQLGNRLCPIAPFSGLEMVGMTVADGPAIAVDQKTSNTHNWL